MTTSKYLVPLTFGFIGLLSTVVPLSAAVAESPRSTLQAEKQERHQDYIARRDEARDTMAIRRDNAKDTYRDWAVRSPEKALENRESHRSTLQGVKSSRKAKARTGKQNRRAKAQTTRANRKARAQSFRSTR